MDCRHRRGVAGFCEWKLYAKRYRLVNTTLLVKSRIDVDFCIVQSMTSRLKGGEGGQIKNHAVKIATKRGLWEGRQLAA